MKTKKITELSWYQVRARGGINYKEYQRRLKISAGLKKYFETGLTRKERKQKISITEDRQRIKKGIPPKKRIRQQLALNFINRGSEDYSLEFISIRAITINPEININGLRIAILELRKETEQLLNINLNNYYASYEGLELKEISKDEDRTLNDNKIHLEIFSRGKVLSRHTK